MRDRALAPAIRGGTGRVYERVQPLGTGSMGETWLGVCVDANGIEWRVCLKFIRPDKRADPELEAELKALFVREARMGAALRSSNIAQLLDFDAEQFCLVYELVEGDDLRTLINHSPRRRLSANQTVAIAIELCKALRRAHEHTSRGQLATVIHRDLSPANVLLSYDGHVKLIDFGVSCVVTAGEPPTENVRGKLPYMSPEQTQAAELDARSDLFSLGVLLFEMLAGARPFDGRSHADTVRRIHRGIRPALRDLEPTVPAELASIVDRLLMPRPNDRFESANACMDALSQLAPPATTLRDLGDFLGRVRPRKTITTTTIPEESPRAAALEPTLRIAPPRPEKATLPYPQNASFRRTLGISGPRPRWLRWAAAAGCVVTIGVWAAATRPARVHPTKASAGELRAERPLPIPPPQSEARLVARDTGALEGPRPAVPAASTPEPAASQPASTADAAPARLRVGVVPISRVWIDGELRGWSPITATLPPGRHTVVVGTSDGRRREVELQSGKLQKLIVRRD